MTEHEPDYFPLDRALPPPAYPPEEIARLRGVMKRRRIPLLLLIPLAFVSRGCYRSAWNAPEEAGRAGEARIWFVVMIVVGVGLFTALWRLFSCPGCGALLLRHRTRECPRCRLPF